MGDATSSDLLILVDDADRECGTLAKGACHEGEGILHRAFSIFLFNDAGEVLLQQRSELKPLWPLFWSNSCCSHPRHGEDSEAAALRRLHEELGVTASLEYCYKFQYHARYLDRGSERELCWVWVGRQSAPVVADPAEIAAVRYLSPEELDRELAVRPSQYTPWLHLEWRHLRANFPGLWK